MPSPIPLMRAKGPYELKLPWVADPKQIYECTEQRTYQALEVSGVDVYTTYYLPKGLEQAVYERDRDAGEYILTLTSNAVAAIHVPSSYLARYPDQNVVPYQWVVISASLDLLPDTMDLTFAQEQMATLLADIIGVKPRVRLSTLPFNETITVEESLLMERARKAAIKNQTTDRAKVVALENTNTLLREQLNEAHRIIQANNLIPS